MKYFRNTYLAKFSEALEHLYEPVSVEKFPQRLFAVVSSLLPEVMMSFDEVNKNTGALRHARNFEPPSPAEWLERLAINIQRDHPGMTYLRNGGSERVLQLSDFISRRQLRETALYRENYIGPGIEHQIAVVLPIPGYFAGLAVNRGSKFTEDDTELLRLLCPHFARAYDNARLLESETPVSGLEHGVIGKVAKQVGLSPRESEVLYWVAQGKRDSEIGAILGISKRTVGKHLQHIFNKLNVETRTSAATEALRLGGRTG